MLSMSNINGIHNALLVESKPLERFKQPFYAGPHVSFSLIFDKPTDPFMKSMVKACEAAIHAYVSKDVEVTIETEFTSSPRPKANFFCTAIVYLLLRVIISCANAK